MQILLTLQYLREYRTFFHIAQDWGIHESTAYRIVKRIEDVLIQAEEFRLPGRKQLQEAAILLQETKIHPAELKDRVTSPGGTTIAGVTELERGGFRAAIINAVLAACKRSQELGKY